MARSIRVLYQGERGLEIRKNRNWDAINLDSAVTITAAQFLPSFGGFVGGPKTRGRPHLGLASVWVTNVGPHGVQGFEAGGVEFFLNVDWPSPLDVIVTITVHEDIEQYQT